jgi:hypothetical protein
MIVSANLRGFHEIYEHLRKKTGVSSCSRPKMMPSMIRFSESWQQLWDQATTDSECSDALPAAAVDEITGHRAVGLSTQPQQQPQARMAWRGSRSMQAYSATATSPNKSLTSTSSGAKDAPMPNL